MFQSQAWKDLLQEIQVVYKNADELVHTQNNAHREIYVGKCLAIKEILAIEDKINQEMEG